MKEKYRLHEWLNLKTHVSNWGIQAQSERGSPWRHMSAQVDGVQRGLIYETRADAERVMRGYKFNMPDVDITTGLVPL